MLEHFVSYILILVLQLFHVKPYEASEAETNIFVSISEPIKVAIVGQSPTCGSESRKNIFVYFYDWAWACRIRSIQTYLSALKFSITFLENKQLSPPPHKIHKIYVDNILINVEMLLRFECGEHACMFYIFKPTNIALAQKLLSRMLRKVCLHTFHSWGVEFALAQMLLRRSLQKQFFRRHPDPLGEGSS